jgi:hypothetical protein
MKFSVAIGAENFAFLGFLQEYFLALHPIFASYLKRLDLRIKMMKIQTSWMSFITPFVLTLLHAEFCQQPSLDGSAFPTHPGIGQIFDGRGHPP